MFRFMFGFPTGDLHSLCNAPKLGAHKPSQRTRFCGPLMGGVITH